MWISFYFIWKASLLTCVYRLPSYLQHGSYPVVSPLGAEYPDNFYLSRTSLIGLSSQSDATWLRYTVQAPLPGDWFAAAFMLYDDTRITQKVPTRRWTRYRR